MGDHPVGSRWARILVPVGLVAGILVALVAGGSPGPGGEAAVPGHLAVGMPAPDFVAPGLSGGTVALAHYAGHPTVVTRSEEHTSELQSRFDLVCRLLL